jgi:hypothetical protein
MLSSLEKIASDFFDIPPHSRRQKAWFLPPAAARSYAQAGAFDRFPLNCQA